MAWTFYDSTGSIKRATTATVTQIPTGGKHPGEMSTFVGPIAPADHLFAQGQSLVRASYPVLFDALVQSKGTATVTLASPGVWTLTGHGLVVGDRVYVTTTGALPTGMTADTNYYVMTVPTADTFTLGTTRTVNAAVGTISVTTAVNTSVSQSGVHTVYHAPWGTADSTHFNIPDMQGMTAVGATIGGVLGITWGEAAQTLAQADLPNVSLRVTGPGAHKYGTNYGSVDAAGENIQFQFTPDVVNSTNTYGGADGIWRTDQLGSGNAHNNMQPHYRTNWIIYLGPSSYIDESTTLTPVEGQSAIFRSGDWYPEFLVTQQSHDDLREEFEGHSHNFYLTGVQNFTATGTIIAGAGNTVSFSGSTASQTLTLPDAIPGMKYEIINRATTAITIARAGSNTFVDGVTTSLVIRPGGRLTVRCIAVGVWDQAWPVGQQLNGGNAIVVSNMVGAGDVQSMTVVGDGTTPVEVSVNSPAFSTSGGAGTGLYLYIRDGSGGGGTEWGRQHVTVAGSGYLNPVSLKTIIPPFTGTKNLYLNLQNDAGTPTLYGGTAYPSIFRAVWVPSYAIN